MKALSNIILSLLVTLPCVAADALSPAQHVLKAPPYSSAIDIKSVFKALDENQTISRPTMCCGALCPLGSCNGIITPVPQASTSSSTGGVHPRRMGSEPRTDSQAYNITYPGPGACTDTTNPSTVIEKHAIGTTSASTNSTEQVGPQGLFLPRHSAASHCARPTCVPVSCHGSPGTCTAVRTGPWHYLAYTYDRVNNDTAPIKPRESRRADITPC